MKIETPFAEAAQIAAAWKPGREVVPSAALRALRNKGALSEGIDQIIRLGGGVLGGRAHLYSSLNRDAARALRSGQGDVARRLAREASTLEGSAPARLLAPLALGVRVPAPSASQALAEAARSDRRVFDAIKLLTKRTSKVRREVLGDDEPQILFGTVVQGGPGIPFMIEVDLTGERLPLVTDRIWSETVRPGFPVCVRVERSGICQLLISYEEALELPTAPATLANHSGSAFDRPLPTRDSAVEIPASLLWAAATVSRPRPIAISED